MDKMTRKEHRRQQMAIRIVGFYLLLGALWIIFSDKVVDHLADDLNSMAFFQTGKGFLFIVLTGCILYLSIKRGLTREEKVGEHHLVKDNRLFKEQSMVSLSYLDPVSGLPNRRFIEDYVDELIQLDGTHHQFALFLIDIDRFRLLNNSMGHLFCDRIIHEVGQRLEGCLKETDVLARFDNKYVAILMDSSAEKFHTTAQNMIRAVSSLRILDKQELFLTVSIGGCQCTRDMLNVDHLFKQAESALNRAKKQGGNQYSFQSFVGLTNDRERMEMANDLSRALERNELCLYYQPQYCVEEGRIIGAEALIRWQHPERGLVSPVVFIPLAEEMGLITAIGEWVLRTACTQNRKWQMAGLPPIKIAVNLSPRQLQQDSFVHIISTILLETKLDPCYLDLEITENIDMFETDLVLEKLREIKAHGVHLSLDDFGVGYSSLSYLNQFPIDKVKIDRSFIQKIRSGHAQAPIVSAIIAMSKNMQVRVLAEGVESEEQLRFLMEQQCDEVQGFLYSKPLPVDQLEKLLVEKLTGLRKD
ncbi:MULTISPECIES: putative bifunctional diguanylate cyclase/phosphodiesterase [Brevibacillus]|uniref:putative bifunctional diguanylate cyclase/phosphodiesterase n=1 Tax=Brevibacillus TaxID=55080 RepID=UPI001FE9DFB5|nr:MULTISPECIES: bifunctional diguanylate cyclase/phosphodiesterase [Brevibacillus]MED1950123.1 bifunctional diguanylate cyclase/phosphodiesterase [Brevibacillus centrosporus]